VEDARRSMMGNEVGIKRKYGMTRRGWNRKEEYMIRMRRGMRPRMIRRGQMERIKRRT
jgi:hypothetical protein